jgi:hypothetical protein
LRVACAKRVRRAERKGSRLDTDEQRQTRQPWHQPLESVCAAACETAGSARPFETVRFYVARWCQKASALLEPDLSTMDSGAVAEVAARVVENLARDGDRVDLLVAGDGRAWTELRQLLYGSSSARVGGAAAAEYADEALQKIAVVLLTGTPPSQAAAQVDQGVEGPRNEYIFTSPFAFWARSVVINLIVDEKRRLARRREGPGANAGASQPHLDAEVVRQAHKALPGLLDAIRELPRVQRAVMVRSLARTDTDPLVLSHLRSLAPDLFGKNDDQAGDGVNDPVPASDRDIALSLGTTTHLVAANRSAARVKLARQNRGWKLLLDVLLPHRSPASAKEDDPDE